MQLELDEIVKILNRIEALECKVSELEAYIKAQDNAKSPVLERPAFPVGEVSEKYKALTEYLYESWERKIELNYAQIEDILGFALPPTAYKLPFSYWANTKTHSYASSWLAIGYKAKVIDAQKIVFERELYQGE